MDAVIYSKSTNLFIYSIFVFAPIGSTMAGAKIRLK